MSSDDYEELALQLEQVSERLGDLSMMLVRDAIESGSDRPEDDRIIAQARRSVDKAVGLLRRLTSR